MFMNTDVSTYANDALGKGGKQVFKNDMTNFFT